MVNVKSRSPTSRLLSLSAWIWGAFLLAAVEQAHMAEGQTTDAVCNNTNLTWSFNSKQQTPCLVAAYLLAPCGNGQWTVPALPLNNVYSPPNETQVNNCQCSTVVYSLLSACGACQMGASLSIVRWSSWRAHCQDSQVSISRYPNAINKATSVPAWAYIDVVTPDGFNPANAIRVVNLPESTVGNTEVSASSTTSPVTSSTTTPAAASVGSSTPSSSTPASNTPSSPRNTSAIVGGAVGGVLGLGLIVALIIYLLKQDENKRTKRQAPSAAFSRSMATPDVAAAAGFRSASRQANPLPQPLSSGTSVGHGSSNHGHRGPSPVFQLGYVTGTPWSPPPPSGTPSGAASPMSAESLLSTHNFAGGGRVRGGSFDYNNSSSGHGAGDLLGHSGSISSMRSTIPMMQYAGTPAPPFATSVPVPGITRDMTPTHAPTGFGLDLDWLEWGGHVYEYSDDLTGDRSRSEEDAVD